MTREQLEQGNVLSNDIEDYEGQLRWWEDSHKVVGLTIERPDGRQCRVDHNLIDFDLLKEATIHKIKGELIDLKIQLQKL